MNQLENLILKRQRELNGANEQRQESDRVFTKLHDWIKTIEQQIKDPVTSDLQQPAHVLQERYRQIQVKLCLNLSISMNFISYFSRCYNRLEITAVNSMI